MIEEKESDMTDGRSLLLQDLNFVWNVYVDQSTQKMDAWSQQLENLQRYQKRHGDTDVPLQYYLNPKLGLWVEMQRRAYKDHLLGRPTSLTKGRVNLLEELGFGVTVRQDAAEEQEWERMLNGLRRHREMHDDTEISNGYGANSTLGDWVDSQQEDYFKMRRGEASDMTEGRAKLLEEQGLSLKVKCKLIRPKKEERWWLRLEELRQFREEHGTTTMPRKFPLNQGLADWVNNQRFAHRRMVSGKSSTMTLERAKKLEDLGFKWALRGSSSSLHNTKWFQRCLELKQFKSEFGHTNVPQNYKPNLTLAFWINVQRVQRRKLDKGEQTSLSEERVKALDELGFVWYSRDQRWNNRITELKLYKASNGDCNVPQKFKEMPGLGDWVIEQRRSYKSLCDGKDTPLSWERIKQLEELGLVWSIRAKRKATV